MRGALLIAALAVALGAWWGAGVAHGQGYGPGTCIGDVLYPVRVPADVPIASGSVHFRCGGNVLEVTATVCLERKPILGPWRTAGECEVRHVIDPVDGRLYRRQVVEPCRRVRGLVPTRWRTTATIVASNVHATRSSTGIAENPERIRC